MKSKQFEHNLKKHKRQQATQKRTRRNKQTALQLVR
jgi:hypothetical protein